MFQFFCIPYFSIGSISSPRLVQSKPSLVSRRQGSIMPQLAQRNVKHFIIEANGIVGHCGNWQVVNEYFAASFDDSHYLFQASEVNQYRQTFDGIDGCGERLAQEITDTVQAHPSLKYISMMGHSMGGLMLRYAAGKLFDPSTGMIAGLQPIHFISMATPHLGCTSAGDAQLPILGWVVPNQYTSSMDGTVHTVAQGTMGETGKQLFLEDRLGPNTSEATATVSGDGGPVTTNETTAQSKSKSRAPVVARLAFDVEGEGNFYSALKAFETRTCYGNVHYDSNVGWANSTVRQESQLPTLNLDDYTAVPLAKGVVREDPVECSWKNLEEPTDGIDDAQGSVVVDVKQIVELGKEEVVGVVLRRLQSLPWSRVDCAWRDAWMKLLAHTLIQVTHGWVTREGESVCIHLTQRFTGMEDHVKSLLPGYIAPVATLAAPSLPPADDSR